MNVMLYSRSNCFYMIIKADIVESLLKLLMGEIILCSRKNGTTI